MSLENAKVEEISLVIHKAKQKAISDTKEQNDVVSDVNRIGDNAKRKKRRRQPRIISIANQQNILTATPIVNQQNILTTTPIVNQQNVLAIDCEMVGIGINGRKSALARVSIVDFEGNVVMDTFVKPDQVVTDYRTFVSGVTKESLVDARDFKSVQNEVKDILYGKFVIGHSVFFDFQALKFTHPRRLTRDTSLYEGFINRCPLPHRTPSLKLLAAIILNERIQDGEHDSIEDAKTAMKLYRNVQQEWEEWINVHGVNAAYKNRRIGCFRCGSLEHVVKECPVIVRQQQKKSSKEKIARLVKSVCI
ncbi:12356_t:CDS:2 [Ambispora gerdemannii]|uniref:RNA exonuclease 4 n=1 Tax=Ambispora gerdemannii TaxID=144530 RepID=A0A9N9CPI6_9GLOM|nr:12356_t:CDS:2 [Ambispora gerdemannii]